MVRNFILHVLYPRNVPYLFILIIWKLAIVINGVTAVIVVVNVAVVVVAVVRLIAVVPIVVGMDIRALTMILIL